MQRWFNLLLNSPWSADQEDMKNHAAALFLQLETMNGIVFMSFQSWTAVESVPSYDKSIPAATHWEAFALTESRTKALERNRPEPALP